MSTHMIRRSIAPACLRPSAAWGQNSSQDQLVDNIRGTPFGMNPSLFLQATSALFFGVQETFKVVYIFIKEARFVHDCRARLCKKPPTVGPAYVRNP